MKTAIVTGGAGLIGSCLCKSLSREYKVVCIDNLCTGQKKNIEGLDIEFIEHDITKPLEIEADYIFDMASRASPKDFEKHPIEIMMANSMGVKNLLDLSVKTKAKFLMASTSEVYGDPLEHPQKETYRGNVSTTGPRACYDESKRFAEALTSSYIKEHDVDARIVRIFNTYGPNQKPGDGRVVPNFITQALSGKPITVYGDGTQTRSFCYVEDLVEGIKKAMFTEGTKCGIFNLGNPDEYTILEFAEKVKEAVGSDSQIEYRPLPEDDPARRKPDITRAKEILSWEPKTGLEEGLERTIGYFKRIGTN